MLRRLNDQGVEYVVIGGLAMVTHGASIVTEDLDICYRRTQSNFMALEKAFTDLHVQLRDAPLGLPFQLDALTIHASLNFTLLTDLGPVDLIGEVAGIGQYDAVFALSEVLQISRTEIHVLSLEGLIAAKKATGRLKDRLHLLELEELKKYQAEENDQPRQPDED
jgi:hypothetical protein